MNLEQLKILGKAVGASDSTINIWYPYFAKYLPQNGIDTPERLLAFLAQTAQESGNWHYTEEIDDVGCNNYSGGCKYKGRGLIQLTHLGNYQLFKNTYGTDVVTYPDKVGGPTANTSSAEQLKNSVLASVLYWNNGNLNALADKLDLSKSVYDEPNAALFKCIGRKINRGIHTNCLTPAYGEDVRLQKFEQLRQAYNANKNIFSTINGNAKKIIIASTIAVGVIGISLVSFYLYKKYSKAK